MKIHKWFRRGVLFFAALALIGCSSDDGGGGGADTGASSGIDSSSSSGRDDTASSGEVTDTSSSSSGMMDTSSSGVVDTSSSGVMDTSSSGVPDTSSSGMVDTSSSGMVDVAVCTGSELRCSGTRAEMCSGGQWIVSEDCEHGCYEGACLGPPVPGTCTGPTPLPIDGTPVSGSTDTTYNPNGWTQQCIQQYNNDSGGAGFFPTSGPETVYQMDVPTTQYVTITVQPSPQAPTYMAFYVRGVCASLNTNIWTACKGNEPPSASATDTHLFAAGPHDIIVDSFGTSAADVGDFTITAESALIPACGGSVTQLPMILDLSSGSDTRQDSTMNGEAQTTISQSSQYCNVSPISGGATPGPERVFAFALRERKTVRVELTATDLDDLPLGLYLRPDDCGTRDVNDVSGREMSGVCAVSTNGSTATIERQFPAGAYYIFVDEHDSGARHAFDLTVTLLD